jgi:hypothetical protein
VTRATAIAIAAIVLMALGARFAFWSQIRGTPLDRWHRFDQTDMATYLEQARRIAAGDRLQPEPYHPYHVWQSVAPPEKWLAWYGPHTFHQAPGYSYALAAVLPNAGEEFSRVKALQLALGALSAALAFLIAFRIAGFFAGCAAGALAALYGPAVFLEAQLLREGPAVCALLAIALWLVIHAQAEDWSARRRLLRCAALGLACGALSMFHEMGTVVTASVVAALALAHARRAAGEGTPRLRAAALAAGCAALGWVIGFSPLLARNLAVGAPPLSVSCRATINFVGSNVADAADGGSTFSLPSPSVVAILDEARGSFLSALPGVWRTYHGDVGLFASNLARKFAANWNPQELPDNTSYDFFAGNAPLLRWLPGFGLLFPLAFAGWIALAANARARRRGREWMRVGGGPLELALILGAILAALSLVHSVGRFRMYLVPLLWVAAGIALAFAAAALRERRSARVLALLGLAALGWLLQAGVSPPREVRPADYAIACKLSLEARDVEATRRYVAQAHAAFPASAPIDVTVAAEAERAGERRFAAELYANALAADPGNAFAREGLRRTQ